MTMTRISEISIYCEEKISDEIRSEKICKFVSDMLPIRVNYTQKTILDTKCPMVAAAQIYDLDRPLHEHTTLGAQAQYTHIDNHAYDTAATATATADTQNMQPLTDAKTAESVTRTPSQSPTHTKRSSKPASVWPHTHPAYDGFKLCQIAELDTNRLCTKQRAADPRRGHTLDIILTDILACTFDHTDNRYHARTIIGANPVVISIQGIVDGPARSREYHIKRMIDYAVASHGGPNFNADKNQKTDMHACKYITRNDSRISQVVQGLLLQSVVYYETGQAFCTDSACRMYNAHWQSDLVRTQITNPKLCAMHEKVIHRMQKRN